MNSGPGYYEICVGGRLSEQAAIWFEDMTLTVNEEIVPPQTIIHGYIVDQTALYGLISRIRDLGLTLLSVNRSDTAENVPKYRSERRANDQSNND